MCCHKSTNVTPHFLLWVSGFSQQDQPGSECGSQSRLLQNKTTVLPLTNRRISHCNCTWQVGWPLSWNKNSEQMRIEIQEANWKSWSVRVQIQTIPQQFSLTQSRGKRLLEWSKNATLKSVAKSRSSNAKAQNNDRMADKSITGDRSAIDHRN